MALIREIIEPQDIYIVGEYFEDVERTFGITDDYSTLDITNGIKTVMIDTCGVVYVFTKDEFIEAFKSVDENWEEDNECLSQQEGVLLRNFTGKIELKCIAQESNEEYGLTKGQDVLLEDFDRAEDAWYQYDDKYRDEKKYGIAVRTKLLLVLPEGTDLSDDINSGELLKYATGLVEIPETSAQQFRTLLQRNMLNGQSGRKKLMKLNKYS
jgi:hypothetical protein